MKRSTIALAISSSLWLSIAHAHGVGDLSEEEVDAVTKAVASEFSHPQRAGFDGLTAISDEPGSWQVCGHVVRDAFSDRVPFYAWLLSPAPPEEPFVMLKVVSNSDAVTPQVYSICRREGVTID